ncbi:zinc finger BED domain-containing protein RICESLEEPER 2-like protein [Tanacetum coccineum]
MFSLEYEPHFSHLPSDEDWENVKAVSNVVTNNAKEVLDALDQMFKDYVETHDSMVRDPQVIKVDLVEGAPIRDQMNTRLDQNGKNLGTFIKYPVLSKMVRDVLAILVSTVASKTTFSVGGRVIDPYRSALKSNTIEMLLYGGDWIRQNYGIKKKVRKEDIPTEVVAAYSSLRVPWSYLSLVAKKKSNGDVSSLLLEMAEVLRSFGREVIVESRLHKLGTISLIPSKSYLATFVLVKEVMYVLPVLLPCKYARWFMTNVLKSIGVLIKSSNVLEDVSALVRSLSHF